MRKPTPGHRLPLSTLGRRPFNLTRWFSLLSLACVASISAVSALLLSSFLTEKMLNRDALLSMEFVQAAVLSDKAAAYFLAGQPRGAGKDLESTFKRLAQMPDVLRANVYARDRSVVWSSDPNLVGTNFSGNPELDEALDGELVINSGIVRKEEHVKAGHPFSEKYFIETYVPLWADERRNVIGVVELYRTPDALFEAIHDGQRLIWASALLGGLFLYAALFWIVRHADRIMRKQHERLVETETFAAVGEMASAVAHGIRNPLASIRSSAELTLEDGSGALRESAQDIIAEVDRMEQWVRDLLGCARLASDGFDTIELNAVIRRSLDNFAREMDKRNIDVSAQLEDTLPVVRGDSSLLGQVFNSLLVNALEAMPAHGRLTVGSRLAGDRKHVEVSFSDTGTGIEAAELGKVLRPFHTTKPKGLGLGLPLARRIVERHGGTLAIASTAGAGTAVTLRFIAAG